MKKLTQKDKDDLKAAKFKLKKPKAPPKNGTAAQWAAYVKRADNWITKAKDKLKSYRAGQKVKVAGAKIAGTL
jgi:hypothetical protein